MSKKKQEEVTVSPEKLKESQLVKTEEKTPVMGIVMPAVTPDQAVEAWKMYQDLKSKIATKSDKSIIQGKVFYNKSYWRKIATFFNLSVEITEERKEGTETNLIYHFTEKATAPNGRFAYGTGSCDQMEKGRRNSVHNTRSVAETRAFNRAVSNLVGGGEVSSEEVSQITPVAEKKICTVNHATLPVKTSQKVGSENFGRSFVHCENCDYWSWIDKHIN